MGIVGFRTRIVAVCVPLAACSASRDDGGAVVATTTPVVGAASGVTTTTAATAAEVVGIQQAIEIGQSFYEAIGSGDLEQACGYFNDGGLEDIEAASREQCPTALAAWIGPAVGDPYYANIVVTEDVVEQRSTDSVMIDPVDLEPDPFISVAIELEIEDGTWRIFGVSV
jgi:hypothetical protein